uniref:Myticalin C4 n=1 Tax=Mytilus californianus TaxID=6549 RepID=A0A286RMU9_MYTCA|nr:myticalin C4 [Mytilus californianus]
MKGIILMLLTILVALYMINDCEGRRRRRYRYWRRGVTIQGRSKYSTLNTGEKRETLNGDIQNEGIENVDSEDGHLDERYVDMNDNDVMDDIDERYVDDPQEDD